MTKEFVCSLIDSLCIVQADLWDCNHFDLVEPAYITFEDKGLGEFALGRVRGGLDCEGSRRIILFA